MAPRVDISADVEAARSASASATEEDGPYGELMATYVELGELLDSDTHAAFLPRACLNLVDQLIELDVDVRRHWEQRWFAWMARNTTFDGEAEGGQ